tara:strand:- start:64549 stop:65265 length:717 start_codon:yes stop_codon:yes gene_type:complete
MNILNKMNVKIFADGADKDSIIKLNEIDFIKGFTTNPTLMRKAGVKNYKEFAKSILSEIKYKPISFEIFADELDGMISQAKEIASWAPNVNVKIPITNTKGLSTASVIEQLTKEGVKCNITAIFSIDQCNHLTEIIDKQTPLILSIFAGRIADTGVDPCPIMKRIVDMYQNFNNVEILWASPRELLNIFHANESGCHIITVANDILKKIDLIDKDLNQFSLETVKMFYNDAVESKYSI